MASKAARERRRAAQQSNQVIRNTQGHPVALDDAQTAIDDGKPVTNGHFQVAHEPGSNGHHQVADKAAPHEEAESAVRGDVQIASEKAVRKETLPATGAQVPVAHEPAVQKEATPATNGHRPLADEFNRLAQESAQPMAAEERLPSQFSQSINDALSRRQTLPGFADPRLERISAIELPPWFIDRCRSAPISRSASTPRPSVA